MSFHETDGNQVCTRVPNSSTELIQNSSSNLSQVMKLQHTAGVVAPRELDMLCWLVQRSLPLYLQVKLLLASAAFSHVFSVLGCLFLLQDQFDTIDLSDNEVRKVDGFPYLRRLKCIQLNNNRVL